MSGLIEIKEKIEKKPKLTQIAIWEQNHEGQIKNYKKWTTTEENIDMIKYS